MRSLVTGGAGFIGSQLCLSLLETGQDLTILDNFSSGKLSNIGTALNGAKDATLVKGDCKNPNDLKRALRDVQTIFHFAANPEVRLDHSDPSTCFQENVYATRNVLEQMENSNAEVIVFASSSTVYGDAKIVPTPEGYGPLEPISMYGASKLAAEALISAYCHTYGKKAIILRFANVVGPTNEHGVVRDFLRKISQHKDRLQILGDGHQTKSYLYIDDCVSAILAATNSARQPVSIFNVASEDQIDVQKIARLVIEEANVGLVDLEFTRGSEGGGGWNGDVKNMHLDLAKLKSLGWRPKYSSEEAIRLTVRTVLKRRLLVESRTTPPLS